LFEQIVTNNFFHVSPGLRSCLLYVSEFFISVIKRC